MKGTQALAIELPERSGHEHQQSGNAASFLAENEKKDDSIIVFSVGAVDGTCSATLRAQAFRTPFFCSANAVDTPGTINSAPCCFLNVPFKSITPLQKKKTCENPQ